MFRREFSLCIVLINVIRNLIKCSGKGELYEDDGKTTQYLSGRYTKTVFSFTNL